MGWIGDSVNKPKLAAICMLSDYRVLPCCGATRSGRYGSSSFPLRVLDDSVPFYWASVGDFFGPSFGTIRGTMNLFYTWGSVLGPVIAAPSTTELIVMLMVLTGMTVLLVIAALFTATLINPWATTQQLHEVPVKA